MIKYSIYLSIFISCYFTTFAQLNITVILPNGGENWQTGFEQTITWSDNITEDVKIDLYKGGVFDSELFASTFSDGSKFWTIPLGTTPGSDYKIKISSVDSSNVFDFSDADFTIFPSDITISVPNGGESWQAGTTQTITWADNIAENVFIELYKGGSFHSVIVSGTASDGVRNWSIPFLLESGSDYAVKITSVDNSGIFDFSDTNFTIVGSQVNVTSPNGGEDWLIGSFQNITWTENLVGNVEIDLFKSGVFHSEITGGTVNDSLYIWNIPASLEQGSDYKIRITSVIASSIFDFTDADFTLSHQIIVSSPNGGETWQAGTEQFITWTDNFSENVKIALYKGGLFHTEIDPSNSSDGSKFWEIPFVMDSGSDYSIKIKSVDDPNPFDSSADYYFNITANTITENSPNGGETWLIGSVQEITWTDNLEGDVEILLYKGGILHTIISSSTASDGFSAWTVPTIEQGNDYQIKILSVVTAEVYDQSDSNFTITSRIDVNDILSGISTTYELFQNFPNPFNPSTTIYYALPKEGSVELKIYDILGNEIMTFNEEEQSAGYHKIEFDATRFNSGVYIYRLQAGIFVETKKMILLR